MARTPLAGALERIAAEHTLTRRGLIGAGAAALAAAHVPRAFAAPASPPSGKVVVVGAGLAGLTAAYRLRQGGVAAEVHEASARLGGRCWSLRGLFADGQVAERGGELIDTGHTAIRQLAQELRLPTDDLLQGEQNGTEPLYFFDGKPYTYAEAAADFNGVYQKLHRDTSEASYPTTYAVSTPRGRQLDAMSITQWIAESVPGGLASRFGQLLDVAYEIEYGAPCGEQSALTLIYLLGYSGQGKLRLFGPSNEKFHIRGGNDLMVTRLAEAVKGQVRTGSELVALRPRGAQVDLTFRQGARTVVVTADRVVLTVPFSILRRSVDWSAMGWSARKQRAIRELGMGASTKINAGFTSRHWRALGCNGDTYADTGYQATWEVSRAQAGASGILVGYSGGPTAAGQTGSAASVAQRFLGQLEPVLPGITARWDGRVAVDNWALAPWVRGGYSYYRPGQYTAFGAAEAEREGAVHFAGEHTTQDFQGYLNGAIVTGERAAREVLSG
jgi:monoamine oxidase